MEEKKLVVFCCENSSLVSARALQYDDEKGELFGAVRIVPLPCSGKIEMGIILKALEEGAPGVLVLGCPVDNCKFFRGNVRAGKRVGQVKMLLSAAGIDPGRVRMDYLSSVDPHKFERFVAEMLDSVRSFA